MIKYNLKSISYKWVFIIKYNLNSTIIRYKVKQIANKFFQVHEIDYTKTFILIIRCKSLKIFLIIAVLMKIILIQIDVIKIY